MKIKYYLVLLLVFCGQFSNANEVENKVIWFSSYVEKVNDPVMPQLPNIQNCDNDVNNDGITFFNLSSNQTPIILASQSTAASNYSVSYHLTATDAVTGANPISNTSSYINLSNPQTIYARVQNNTTSQFEVGNFQLIVNPQLVITAPTLFQVCDNDSQPNDSFTTFNLLAFISPYIPSSGYTISFYLDASFTINISNPSSFVNTTQPQTIFYKVTNNSTGCIVYKTLTLNVLPVPTPNTDLSGLLISACDLNSDGFETIDLTINSSYILNGDTNVSLHYFNNLNNALLNTNEILNPTAANVNGNVWIRVESNLFMDSNNNYCYSIVEQPIDIKVTPTLITPPNFSLCDTDGVNDGYYSFSLSSLIPSILGQSQNPSDYTVSFYESLSNAQNGNAISNPVNYQTYTHTIWISVFNNFTGCLNIGSFNTTVEQLPQPIILANSNVICVDYATNNLLTSQTLTAVNTTSYLIQNPPTSYSYQWYNDGVPVGVGSTYTISSPLPNSGTSSYTVEMISNSILSCNGVSAPFSIFQSGPASPIGIGYSIVNNAGNQVITVEVEGYGSYEYQLDSGPQQSSNVFSNVTLGTHTITVYDIEGGVNYSCNPINITNVNVNLTPTPPPTGNAIQSFNQGATLANMQVTGQNIQWYSGANKNAVSLPLPLNTLLVDGTTYFASQKIGGYESTTRLPVTAQIVLANADFELSGLVFAPNPVSNILKIKCDEVINEVSVYNFLGQIVLNKKTVGSEIEIDLTSLNTANYFVKVQSGNKNSNFKIAKY